jgi:hypothetical protein
LQLCLQRGVNCKKQQATGCAFIKGCSTCVALFNCLPHTDFSTADGCWRAFSMLLLLLLLLLPNWQQQRGVWKKQWKPVSLRL